MAGASRRRRTFPPLAPFVQQTNAEKPDMAANGVLEGKVAIVTGAARGIGRSAAVAMARQGATIVGLDIAGPVSATLDVTPATSGELDETGRLVEAAGSPWHEEVLDQRDIGALRAAAERAVETFGGIDILFANAGIQSFKAILEMEDADWHDQIDVNLTGTMNAIRAVAPHIVKRGGGRIIITSSTQGQHGTKFGSAYSASKWGLLGLMKSAAFEFGPYGITVNAVVPGLIDTPLTRHRERYAQAAGDLHSDKSTEALEAITAEKMAGMTTLGVAFISPDDIAPAVVFLASDAAKMVSGAALDVTGGNSASNAV